LIEEGQYHNNSDLLKFPNVGAANTVYKPLPPLNHSSLSLSQPLLPFIQHNDLLLQYPYQSYDYVLNFFREAVENTEVREIWITQYRVARNSAIMKLLIDAVKKGKKVNVFIEIKARFDEEQNLLWAQELTDAGVNVTFSLPGIKVHCKLALIRRTVNRKQHYSVYISTGNFNESTSKIYSDFGLFTSDERYTSEVRQVFTYLGTGKRPTAFKHLLIGQFGLFEKLQTLIQNEQKFAEQGQSAQIILKINSIEEENIINNLYEASQAGVDIKIIVRGICCLKPGLPEISENIKAISIIDRFLEHARIFVFSNNGNRLIYLSSADIMERNLHRRIECAFPIYNPLHQQEIMDYLDIQLNDNAKARIIDYTNQNQRQITTSLERFESQYETYQYYKNKLST
jgi:polyphosphate kinase